MDNKEIARELVRVAKELGIRKAYFHEKDTLLHGITFEELIVTVLANERVRDEAAVRRVFDELVDAYMRDARAELRANMGHILEAVNMD
jgi:hypothetical protein